MKLGKLPARKDDRDLKFFQYAPALPIPRLVLPPLFGQGGAFKDWGMLGNDLYGDCVWAGAAHETMLWTKLGSHATAHFNDRSVLEEYSSATGFDPDDPSTDRGSDMREAMNYRRKIGITDAHLINHKIGAYVALTPGDWLELMQAIYIFGAVAVGIEFPDSAMDQFNAGKVWDVAQGAKIEGGHYIPAVGTKARTKRVTIVTWGKRQEMTRRFYEKYNDETYAMLSEEVLNSSGKGLHGFDVVTLRADLAALGV